MPGPIIVTRAPITGDIMDTIVELATETIKRREMHRRAGRLVPDMPDEDQVRRLLLEYRRGRGLADYELSERQGQ